MSLHLRVPRHAQTRPPSRQRLHRPRGRLHDYSGEYDVFRELTEFFSGNLLHLIPFEFLRVQYIKLEFDPPLRTIGDSSPLVCLKIF